MGSCLWVNNFQVSRTRFSEEQELALLRSVARSHPFHASFGRVMETWDTIGAIMSATFNAKFTGRGCQEKCTALLDNHATDDAGHSFRSGTNEEHDERHDLLNEIAAERQSAEEKKAAASTARKKKAEREAQKLTEGALALLDAEHRLADRESSSVSASECFSPPPTSRSSNAQSDRKRKHDTLRLLEQQVKLQEERIALEGVRMNETREERKMKLRLMEFENERATKDAKNSIRPLKLLL